MPSRQPRRIATKDATIYDALSELLEATLVAHQHNDKASLHCYYAFAKWCLQQKERNIWNAAAIAFYEHLPDNDETFQSMHPWVDKDVYLQIKGLLQAMIPM